MRQGQRRPVRTFARVDPTERPLGPGEIGMIPPELVLRQFDEGKDPKFSRREFAKELFRERLCSHNQKLPVARKFSRGIFGTEYNCNVTGRLQ